MPVRCYRHENELRLPCLSLPEEQVVFAEPLHVASLTGTKKPPEHREVQSCILIWGFASFPSLNTFAPPANKAKEEYEYEKDKTYKVSDHRFVLFT